MNAVTVTYILGEPNIALGQFIPIHIASNIGIVVAVVVFIVYFILLLKMRVLKKDKNQSNKDSISSSE